MTTSGYRGRTKGAIRLADLSAMDIKRWHGTLLDHGRRDGKPLAVDSVKLARRVLHRALADGVRWNVLPTNPASSVRVPNGEHEEMTEWTSEEPRRLIDSRADDRLRGSGRWRCTPGCDEANVPGCAGATSTSIEEHRRFSTR